MSLCCRSPSNGTMNPSDFQCSRSSFHSSLIDDRWLCKATALDLPSCTAYLPLHTTPITPEDPFSHSHFGAVLRAACRRKVTVFPIKSEGQHLQLVNEANTDSLALRPVALPLQNLQHSITQILLCGTTEMNGQFLGQDFNLLDMLPVTAYDLTP